MNSNLTIAMTAHYKNYTEQFKKWFLKYKQNFTIRVNLLTNLPEEFKDFKYDNLFIYSVEELITGDTKEKKLLLEKSVPYNKFPWNMRRHIIKKSFDLGYRKVLYLENDLHINCSQEQLEKIIDLTEINTICTTQSIWCKTLGGPHFNNDSSVGWLRSLNEKYNLDINAEGFCAYDAPDIFYNFTEEMYKNYFNWWDKMSEFNDTYYTYHNSGKIFLALNAKHKIKSKRYPIKGITLPSYFLNAKHDFSVHYDSPFKNNPAWKHFFLINPTPKITVKNNIRTLTSQGTGCTPSQ